MRVSPVDRRIVAPERIASKRGVTVFSDSTIALKWLLL